MDNVTALQPNRPISPWRVITIGRSPGGDTFDIVAFDGAPSQPGVARLYLGTRETVLDASIFAHAKAAQLNIWEVADFTDVDWSDDDDAA